MKIVCPHCGSDRVQRLPGTASNGWNLIQAGVFTVGLAIFLPIGATVMVVMGCIGLLLGGIGCLYWLVAIGRAISSSRPVNWSWECEACENRFVTAPLD